MTVVELMKITLVTCVDYDATERIIVKGDLKDTKDYSQTPEEILTAFNQPYKQRLLKINQ